MVSQGPLSGSRQGTRGLSSTTPSTASRDAGAPAGQAEAGQDSDLSRVLSTLQSLQTRLAALERKVEVAIDLTAKSFWQTADGVEARHPALSARCIVCGYESARTQFKMHVSECKFGGGRLERYECPQCDAIFGPLKILSLLPHQLNLEYRALYATYQEGNMTDAEVRTFHSLQPKTGGLYLNWGCGAWAETIPVLRRNWDVWGFEPSAEIDSDYVARHRWQITATFDGLFSNNVIEHLIDPVEEFRYFHSILKPGGRMAHSSPCYAYMYAYTRFHTVFLIGRSVQVLAERTGFRVADRIQDGEYINYVFEKI
jgi:hypothetical protein